jgi:hypothetical protein
MKWNHHIPLILELEPIRGFYIPECTLNELKSLRRREYLFKIPNKGYRNFAYALHASLSNTNQSLVDISGSSRTFNPDSFVLTRLNLGSSPSPHDITRYELYNRYFGVGPLGVHWLVEETSKTSLTTFHRYSFSPPDRAIGEVGLYFLCHWLDPTYGEYLFYTYLIARTIIDPSITKYANTLYEEGWQIDFPSNYTRWFLRAYFEPMQRFAGDIGSLITDINGALFALRQRSPWAGSPDIMIGSDNTTPSPTDYALKSPIGSLSSQSQSVEIDTSLQECRVVRTGNFTPSTNVTLGEVALFTNVYDASGTARKIMVARGVWDTPVTLTAGTTYTIGIALKLG